MEEVTSRPKAVKALVNGRLYRLASDTNESAVRAELARMRRGIGKRPGEDPALWGMLFEGMPEEMEGKQREPSREEWAVYTALTLYALHQQSKDMRSENMNEPGRGLGEAAAGLTDENGEMTEAVRRRFNATATSADITELAWHLKEIIQLLKREGIGLDYGELARDLYSYQFPDGMSSVRLKWGRDFYYTLNKNQKEKREEAANE